MVSVLRFAYDYDCESQLTTELLQQTPLPEHGALQKRILQCNEQPIIPPRQHDVVDYDQLLHGGWATQESNHV